MTHQQNSPIVLPDRPPMDAERSQDPQRARIDDFEEYKSSDQVDPRVAAAVAATESRLYNTYQTQLAEQRARPQHPFSSISGSIDGIDQGLLREAVRVDDEVSRLVGGHVLTTVQVKNPLESGRYPTLSRMESKQPWGKKVGRHRRTA